MSRKLLSISCAATLLGTTAMADVPNVAADIAPVHSLIARVMQGVGTPNLVIPAGASPHEYNLRPSEAAALQNANVVFWLGEDMTPWMENAVETLAAEAKVIGLLDAEGTKLLDFREGALFEAHDHGDEEHGHDDHGHDDHAEKDDHDHEAHDDHDHAALDDHDHDKDHDDHAHDKDHAHDNHAAEDHAAHDHDDHGHKDEHAHDDHGHAHGAHDPHAWLSPQNAQTWIGLIAAELSAVDPDNAAAYAANAAAARAELTTLVSDVNATLAPARGHSFVVFHDAYQYFEVDFDFPASGAISIGDASDPSPARIAEIQGRIRSEGIDCVLAEPQFNPGLIQTVLDGTEANTGIIDPLGAALPLGPGLYPQLIRNMASTLSDCLE